MTNNCDISVAQEELVPRLILQVRSRNNTIDRMLDSKLTVDEWIKDESQKLKKNNLYKPVQCIEDFTDIAAEYVRERLGLKEAEEIGKALSLRALHTADHLGGFYSSQSFQGDLFFARLLLGVSKDVPVIPILTYGCVPLISSTYARGIITYTETCEALHIPIFPKKPTGAIATLTKGFDRGLVTRARDRALPKISRYLVKKEVKRLFNELYLREDILSLDRFPDQAFFIGKGIMDRIPQLTGGKSLIYLEAEELFAKLIIKDMDRKNSILYELLFNVSYVKRLNDLYDLEGRPLASLLFRGCDEEKRYFILSLEEDGYLRGRKNDGETVEISVKSEILKEKLLQREIIPDVYLSWFLTGFLRGFSFYGGVFQSCYLPDWHKLTLEALRSCGYYDLADSAENYDFSGYISGPIVMLYDTVEGAVNAGPFEVLAKMPEEERFLSFLKTDIRSAHEMGMFEFYNDLISSENKSEGWYESIARYSKARFSANIL
ncbi:hypothetical protein SAMN06296386_11015 [Lachnospiraceae bacterium]|nr:hypothetical protein SAMN06296386_11015 [Lachnospiraceae bacterium]